MAPVQRRPGPFLRVDLSARLIQMSTGTRLGSSGLDSLFPRMKRPPNLGSKPPLERLTASVSPHRGRSDADVPA